MFIRRLAWQYCDTFMSVTNCQFDMLFVSVFFQNIVEINKMLCLISQPSLPDFRSAYDVVFIDPSGYLNLCASMSKDMYLRVSICKL